MRRRLLLLYALLLLFLNLTPRVPSSPVANGDKLAHLVEFAALGFIGWRWWAYLLPLPFLLEFFQLFVPGRTFSFADIGANLIGFTLGLIAGWWYEGSHEGTEVSNEGRD
ncbi:VanZ family protein [Thermococcus sp. 18S1]|uniref:VanZ family protein n=1 Tax=Thermococcus sp. 18S1 TaxID=1638210 RepID=UPI00143BAC90|nr:VanZ family protein [Thermococcus sp. 18S1]NJE29889.1 VanZ family protein [Thermococcus sp. 18S1]